MKVGEGMKRSESEEKEMRVWGLGVGLDDIYNNYL